MTLGRKLLCVFFILIVTAPSICQEDSASASQNEPVTTSAHAEKPVVEPPLEVIGDVRNPEAAAADEANKASISEREKEELERQAKLQQELLQNQQQADQEHTERLRIQQEQERIAQEERKKREQEEELIRLQTEERERKLREEEAERKRLEEENNRRLKEAELKKHEEEEKLRLEKEREEQEIRNKKAEEEKLRFEREQTEREALNRKIEEERIRNENEGKQKAEGGNRQREEETENKNKENAAKLEDAAKAEDAAKPKGAEARAENENNKKGKGKKKPKAGSGEAANEESASAQHQNAGQPFTNGHSHDEGSHSHSHGAHSSGGFSETLGQYFQFFLRFYRPFVNSTVENLETLAAGPLLSFYVALKQNEIALLCVFGLGFILIIKLLTDLLGKIFTKKAKFNYNCYPAQADKADISNNLQFIREEINAIKSILTDPAHKAGGGNVNQVSSPVKEDRNASAAESQNYKELLELVSHQQKTIREISENISKLNNYQVHFQKLTLDSQQAIVKDLGLLTKSYRGEKKSDLHNTSVQKVQMEDAEGQGSTKISRAGSQSSLKSLDVKDLGKEIQESTNGSTVSSGLPKPIVQSGPSNSQSTSALETVQHVGDSINFTKTNPNQPAKGMPLPRPSPSNLNQQKVPMRPVPNSFGAQPQVLSPQENAQNVGGSSSNPPTKSISETPQKNSAAKDPSNEEAKTEEKHENQVKNIEPTETKEDLTKKPPLGGPAGNPFAPPRMPIPGNAMNKAKLPINTRPGPIIQNNNSAGNPGTGGSQI